MSRVMAVFTYCLLGEKALPAELLLRDRIGRGIDVIQNPHAGVGKPISYRHAVINEILLLLLLLDPPNEIRYVYTCPPNAKQESANGLLTCYSP